MRKIGILVAMVTAIGFAATTVEAGNCYMDPIVKRWMQERDVAAENTVRLWAKGSATDEFVSNIAIILSNEFYLFSQCREQPDFIKEHVYVINGGSDPEVQHIPALILEHLMGTGILSPWRQFPSSERKERVQ